MTDADAAALRSRVTPLIGQAGWGVAVGHGSFLTLEFGAGAARDGGKPHGEWHLWLYMTAWRVDDGDRIAGASEDDRARMEDVARLLERQTLTALEVSAPSGDLTLRFGATTLRTFAIESNAEQWMLYTPAGTVVRVGIDGGWTEIAADAPA